MRLEFTIPYPPSANRLWRAVQGRNIKSAAYRTWIDEAVWSLKAQRPGCVTGHYHIAIVATPPDRRARDIDNLIKAISDAVAKAGIVGNDSNARRLTAEWAPGVVKGGAVRVVVDSVPPVSTTPSRIQIGRPA